MHKERNLNYDLIRLLGLLIIMVAHSSPPEWLFQLRNFGTPLLVVGSALTYALIYTSRRLDAKKFFSKRMARLVLPAWIFLSFFFVFFYFAFEFLGKEYPFSLNKILSSYAFLGGIGYVWVFKIYIILALITPIAINLNRRVKSNSYYFLALILSYISYEIAVNVTTPLLHGITGKIFNQIFFIIIPYSILYFYGFRLAQLKAGNIMITAIISLIIFCALMVLKYIDLGEFVPTENYKYPPTLYYFSYAFFAINVIYLLVSRISISSPIIKQVIIWLSSNSLWIYLWHIMADRLWLYLLPSPTGEFIFFIEKTVFLLVFGCVCTAIQNKLVVKLSKRNLLWRKHISPLLSGNV